MKTLLRQALPVTISLLVLLGLWEIVAHLPGVPDYLLPTPEQVFAAGWRDKALIGTHLAATVKIALVGFALGTIIGIVMAIVITASDVMRRATEPILIASQAIPPIIIAPIVISAMGFGIWPKVLVVAAGAFFPVSISTSSAMRQADGALVDLLASMGAGRATILRRIRLPSAVPGLVAGAKISASYVVFTAIVAEWMGSAVGLGVYLQRSQASYRMDQLFAAVGVIALLGVVLFWIIAVAGSLILARSRAASATHY